jgi:hypothetical protein
VRFLYTVRILTLTLAVSYLGEALPNRWLDALEERFSKFPGIYETGHSLSIYAGEIGIYLLAPVAILLLFCAVPRFRWGASALSWCFLLMGACQFANVERGYWDRYLSVFIQIVSYSREVCFALPPIIFGIFLRYGFVQQALSTPPTHDQNV